MQNRIRATLAAAALAIAATAAPIAAPVMTAAVVIAAPAPAQASVVLAERAKPSPLQDLWAIIMSVVLSE